jgi:hypothetical protein
MTQIHTDMRGGLDWRLAIGDWRLGIGDIGESRFNAWGALNPSRPALQQVSPSVPLQDEVLDFDEDFHAAGRPHRRIKRTKTTDGHR